MSEKNDLLQYAIKMRQRGDSYQQIASYLSNKTEDENLRSSVIKQVTTMEETNQLEIKKEESDTPINMEAMMGVIFVLLGIGLMVFLWNKGYIAALPVGLISLGLITFFKALRK